MRFFNKLRRMFARKPARRASFRPGVEGLETREVPTVLADYWQPNTDNNWSTPGNWSLNRTPVWNDVQGQTTYQDIAEFDNLHTGNGHTGNANCTVDVYTNPYGIDFLHIWAKKLTIAAGITLENYQYFNATGTSNPEITMGSTTSNLYIEAKDSSGPVSTFNGGYIDGSRATFWITSPSPGGNATLNIGTGGYSDSDMIFGASSGSGGVTTNLNRTGGTFTAGKDNDISFKNYSTMVINSPNSGIAIQNSSFGTNTYIWNGPNAFLVTRTDGTAQEIDIPVYNTGTTILYGNLKMDGSYYASDLKGDSTLPFFHFFNKNSLKFSSIHMSASILDLQCKVNNDNGKYQRGFWQDSGTTSVSSSPGGEIDLDGTYADSGYTVFNNGTIDLNPGNGKTPYLNLKDVGGNGGTGTLWLGDNGNSLTIKFYVTTDDANNSEIFTDRLAVTVDKGSILKKSVAMVYGGKSSSSNGVHNFLAETNGSLTGVWKWDFSNTNDPNNWADDSNGNFLAAKH
jgi:hypothetical protein